jgi:hypothetical protein
LLLHHNKRSERHTKGARFFFIPIYPMFSSSSPMY